MLLQAIILPLGAAAEAVEGAITVVEAVLAAMGQADPATAMGSPAPLHTTTWHPLLVMDLCYS